MKPECVCRQNAYSIFVFSYFLRFVNWHVQLHGLLNSVMFWRLVNSRLAGRDLSLLFSRCRDFRAVTPSKAALENLIDGTDRRQFTFVLKANFKPDISRNIGKMQNKK